MGITSRLKLSSNQFSMLDALTIITVVILTFTINGVTCKDIIENSKEDSAPGSRKLGNAESASSLVFVPEYKSGKTMQKLHGESNLEDVKSGHAAEKIIKGNLSSGSKLQKDLLGTSKHLTGQSGKLHTAKVHIFGQQDQLPANKSIKRRSIADLLSNHDGNYFYDDEENDDNDVYKTGPYNYPYQDDDDDDDMFEIHDRFRRQRAGLDRIDLPSLWRMGIKPKYSNSDAPKSGRDLSSELLEFESQSREKRQPIDRIDLPSIWRSRTSPKFNRETEKRRFIRQPIDRIDMPSAWRASTAPKFNFKRLDKRQLASLRIDKTDLPGAWRYDATPKWNAPIKKKVDKRQKVDKIDLPGDWRSDLSPKFNSQSDTNPDENKPMRVDLRSLWNSGRSTRFSLPQRLEKRQPIDRIDFPSQWRALVMPKYVSGGVNRRLETRQSRIDRIDMPSFWRSGASPKFNLPLNKKNEVPLWNIMDAF